MSNAQRPGAGTRSNRRDQAGRRKEIIDAAAALFREKGYAATSIQDVADAVNILKGSLYYYIKSKDDLLFEVIQEVHDGGLKNLEEGKGVDGSALERIRAFVTRHMTYNAPKPGEDDGVLSRLPIVERRASSAHRRRTRPLRPTPSQPDPFRAGRRLRSGRGRPEDGGVLHSGVHELDVSVVSIQRI